MSSWATKSTWQRSHTTHSQRDVFVAHELQGRSFKELADASGVGVNTLLSRKHYAVLHLRKRLQQIYKEFSK